VFARFHSRTRAPDKCDLDGPALAQSLYAPENTLIDPIDARHLRCVCAFFKTVRVHCVSKRAHCLFVKEDI
jgi:hypothetical protein